jgi:hypothetical protein
VARSSKSARADGTWTTVSNTDRIGWTQGFLPGSQWLVVRAILAHVGVPTLAAAQGPPQWE